MRRESKRMRLLREELRYWQMMARMDARLCRLSRRNAKQVGAQMRAEQRASFDKLRMRGKMRARPR